MPIDYYTSTISSIVPLTHNENGVHLNYIHSINNDNSNINLNTNVLQKKSNFLKNCCQKIVRKANNLKIETRGIDRILPEDRNDFTIINTAIMWIGANINVPCFATGILGPAVFKLSLYESFVTIILFNMLGIIPIAAIACFGPISGLRTMVFSRYSWGYYGASIMSILNVISSLGWAAVVCITGAQTLRVVFNDSISIEIVIIIIASVSMIVSFFGYKWIHIYERFSWIPVFIAYIILAGVTAKYFTPYEKINVNSTVSNTDNLRLKVSQILNFGSSCFGFSVSWCSFSADYNTYFPENTSQLKIFLLTYMGNFLSIIPIELLGAATYTGTYINQNWTYAYINNNVGGLLGASLSSLGNFGKFLLVIFALSTVAGTIPNIYSLSLSAQVVAPIFKYIPRFFYTIIGTIIYVLLSIIAAKNFNDSLIIFMDIISYGFGIFIVIIFEDHFIFRHCSYKNYNFDIWNNSKKLPISLAAILSGLVGIIGIVLGMSQIWFTGPIAKAIAGDNKNINGANVGFQMGFIFTAITFPFFRLIELHYIKK